MSFQSLHFLLFALAVVVANRFLWNRPSARKNMLLAASYYFYMCWDWRFAALLVLIALFNYIAALGISRSASMRERRSWLAFALISCLGILAYFKYVNFFLGSAISLAEQFGVTPNLPLLQVILPIGISFFTFQGISYAIDVYRGDQRAERNFRDVALFVAFFPTVLSGPITRGHQLLPQFSSPGPYSSAVERDGFYLILRGFIKKIVFADILAVHFVNPAFSNPEDYSTMFLVLAVWAYSFQIYMDLSGYTDIARGMGKMLGFELPENFNRPYHATSISNFWQRWHMSMSGFFRDYLYFGVGGSKHGNVYANLMITFLAIGMWHGAGWNFIAYGFIHGSFVCWERYRRKRAVQNLPLPHVSTLSLVIRVILIFQVIAFSRILFRSDNFSAAADYFQLILSTHAGPTPLGIIGSVILLSSVLLHILPARMTWAPFSVVQRLPPLIQALGVTGLTMLLLALNSGESTFVYFQF